MMTTEEARLYFKNKGLTYKDITINELLLLSKKLTLHLAKYLVEGGEHAFQMSMRLSKMRKNDKKIGKKGLIHARFRIDGSYFHDREGITFNENGFIGFAGEFSTVNTQPILNAFIEFCDEISAKKLKESECR